MKRAGARHRVRRGARAISNHPRIVAAPSARSIVSSGRRCYINPSRTMETGTERMRSVPSRSQQSTGTAIKLNVAPARDPNTRRKGRVPAMSRKRRAQSVKKATPMIKVLKDLDPQNASLSKRMKNIDLKFFLSEFFAYEIGRAHV